MTLNDFHIPVSPTNFAAIKKDLVPQVNQPQTHASTRKHTDNGPGTKNKHNGIQPPRLQKARNKTRSKWKQEHREQVETTGRGFHTLPTKNPFNTSNRSTPRGNLGWIPFSRSSRQCSRVNERGSWERVYCSRRTRWCVAAKVRFVQQRM